MLSLLDLISQNQPHFQTHQALLVINPQNDFIQPDGRLPANSPNCRGFLERTQALIPRFRQLSTNVIWVQTLYEADRVASDPNTGEGDAVVVGGLLDRVESSTDDDDDDLPREPHPSQSRSARHKQRALDLLKRVSARRKAAPPEASHPAADDEELFLLQTPKKAAACLPDTPGADFADGIKATITETDTILQTTNYSAFLGTRLLLVLRAKLVTELYICGSITNVSVLATVIDAARHGIRINIITDCLGYRKQNRHDDALKRMVDYLDANIVTSEDVLNQCCRPGDGKQRPRKDASQHVDDMLGTRLSELQLDGNPRFSIASRKSSHAPSIKLNGRQRTPSDASYAESRLTTDTRLSDEQFADQLTQGAKPLTENRPAEPRPDLVKSKIRMRQRPNNGTKGEEKKTRAEGSRKGDKGETSQSAAARHVAVAETPTSTPPSQPSKSRDTESKARAAIAKAESSDHLPEKRSQREKDLKSSISQPALSSSSAEAKEAKPPPSRMRLALSRASKSDTNTAQTHSSKSPTKATPVEAPQKSPTPAAEPPLDSSTASVESPKMGKKVQSLATFPVLRPGDRIAEGDSRILYDFFPPELRHPTDRSRPLKDLIFRQLYNEVRWQKMLHQQGEVPRLVCCQGEFGADGSMPVYRHPSDQVLPLLHFSPKVQVVRKQAEKLVGHPLNHVLIQLYRSGNDFISEHSDKTLDIVPGSSIVNVSFGAQRTMRLRTKKATNEGEGDGRNTQRVAMPHNSMFVLGLESNKKWLHGINADKRLEADRSEDERAYAGMRISLTFRHIGTFLDAENTVIWGQGATSSSQRSAADVINDDEAENEKMVRAFSRENHSADFDWDAHYGSGFDVLHFRNAPDDVPILFASNNAVETRMVQIFLAETKIAHVVLEAPPTSASTAQFELDRQVAFRDNDVNHTEVVIALPILLYLDKYHPLDRDDRGRACTSRSFEVLFQVSGLLKCWFNRHVPTYYNDFVRGMEALEERTALEAGGFITGRRFAVADCAAWPVVDEVIRGWEGWSEERFPALAEYYAMLWGKRKSVAGVRDGGKRKEKEVERDGEE